MGALHLLIATVCIRAFTSAFDCKEIERNTKIKNLDWNNLEECITEIGRLKLNKNSSENIWNLIKNVNNGLENIPPSVYANMGNILLAIPTEDLHNITMDVVEIVKAFGSIREGFSEDKLNLIARKVRNEWFNKNPDTYSEYDLISMGMIVCYLNGSDIERIHADAFRYAAEWIGKLKNCPVDRIHSFAHLAVQSDAFGHPSNWSKLDVSIMGNLLKGLSVPEIEAIGKEKLSFNKYFKKASRAFNSTNTSSSN